jgi:alpha-amylase/alpha-mannosidase (GH57 family)
MRTSDPLHIAFVWHMHQPYYRLGKGASFDMPWARMHALKDYLDMVETLGQYPALHMTFNLVPSLVEQLETYASGDFADVYWDHTLKPAADLDPAERAFVVERMCESSDHPRARSYPRYLELARKRDAEAAHGWDASAAAFSVDEIRDLQIWFNLAWFDPRDLERSPLSELVRKGGHFSEKDKLIVAACQQEILTKTLPAYRQAAARGQIEISTSPYFHPILPLLANTDSARIAAADTRLPRSRFSHPEDALEQLLLAAAKHEQTFGAKARGVWCSEQAVGEEVIPLLLDTGFAWTISDETVLARSLSGVLAPRDFPGAPQAEPNDTAEALDPWTLYRPYRLEREGRALSIVFRDHTLSDLIGFAYKSWDSAEAAADLIRRLGEIRERLLSSRPDGPSSAIGTPLVTIALDGENAWEYYPRDGRDFLQHLYGSLSDDPRFRCVTVSEHLEMSPPACSLDWLHTGSWIGGDLRTWIGDTAHGPAWELLHRARDLVHRFRRQTLSVTPAAEAAGEAWRHIQIAQGSDWFWWFGDHHHTHLDHVWDQAFRAHLQEAHRLVEDTVPVDLLYPLLEEGHIHWPTLPTRLLSPLIDGALGQPGEDPAAEWEGAGRLVPVFASTMERAERTDIEAIHYGWHQDGLCLLMTPAIAESLEGLEVQLQIVRPATEEDLVLTATLEAGGFVLTECRLCPEMASEVVAAWGEVLEISLMIPRAEVLTAWEESGLVVRVGRQGMADHVFHSPLLGPRPDG